MTTKPGEVYWVDLGLAAKKRPMVVVSRYDTDAPRALSVCAPITTATRNSRYEVPLGKLAFLRETSCVNVQGLQAIQHHELKQKAGSLSAKDMVAVKQALGWMFDFQNFV